MKSEEFCDTCHYRLICSQGFRDFDEDCPTYRPSLYWGTFDPEKHKPENLKNKN